MFFFACNTFKALLELKKQSSERINTMDIRVLNYFLTIAREENITKAAEALHITQPTLSRQITELEAELHTTLFTRTNRNTRLTEDGIHFKQRAEEILQLVAKTKNEFHPSNDAIYGTIHLGAAETNVIHVITDTFAAMQKIQPAIQYNLYSGTATDVLEKLNQGLLDFGLLLEPVRKETYDYLPMPFSDTLGVLMQKNSPFAAAQGITVEDLLNMPLLLPARINDKIFGLDAWLGQELNLEDLHIAGSYNLIYNAAHMASSGVCNVLTISSLIHTINAENLCFIPLQPKANIRSVLVWKKYQLLPKAARFFLEQLTTRIHCPHT